MVRGPAESPRDVVVQEDLAWMRGLPRLRSVRLSFAEAVLDEEVEEAGKEALERWLQQEVLRRPGGGCSGAAAGSNARVRIRAFYSGCECCSDDERSSYSYGSP